MRALATTAEPWSTGWCTDSRPRFPPSGVRRGLALCTVLISRPAVFSWSPNAAHRALAEQFASRTTEKIYLALVHGTVPQDTGKVTLRISRDPQKRVRMSARPGDTAGRTALTEYKVQQRFEKFTLLRIRIGTGRTHQIRVHFSAIGHPVAGDSLYGGSNKTGLKDGRFFLHAHRIRFDSPLTGERITVESPLPADLEEFLKTLR
jgi:23S rRNA pseudouridine1911/1915/1917 synthase